MDIALELVGELPRNLFDNQEIEDFFYERAEKVRHELPNVYGRVFSASHDILGVGGFREAPDFEVYICPVKVKAGERDEHPILLTYCTWNDRTQWLYWAMDDERIMLSSDERHDVWYNFVQDDQVYFQTGNWDD